MKAIITKFILAVLCLAAALTIEAKSSAFTQVIVFGDSLSDTGNFHALTGYPPAPYADGRFCNGPVWVEYLADLLNAPLTSYAFAGATTGQFNSNEPAFQRDFPGLQDEIQSFLSGGAVDPDALYIVWAGANDFFVTLATGGDPAAMIAAGVGNTVFAIQTLAAAGARHIVVPNVPDLGVTPYALSLGAGGAVTYLSAAYNQALAGALAALESAGISTIRVDAFATLDSMAYDPEQYGFTNVTVPYLIAGGNPSGSLFFDPVHPTTKAHEVLAEEAARSIVNSFSPAKSKFTPLSPINALKGLVKH